MNNTDENNNAKDYIDLGEILQMLIKRRKIIFLTPFVFSIIAIIYSIMATPQYESTTKVIYESTNSGGMSSQLGALAAMAGMGSSSGSNISDYLSDILYSKDFLEPILKINFKIYENDTIKKNLMDFWKMEVDTTVPHGKRIVAQKAVNILKDKFTYTVDKKTSIIKIITTEETPYLAYQLNNTIIKRLNHIILTKLNKKAVENREFIEKGLKESKKALNKSEDRLKKFKEKNIISISPKLLLEQQRLIREIEVDQKVYLTLRQQYEMAKIDEQKDIPVITVVEKADIPYLKSAPQKKKIVIISGLGGIFFGMFFVFVLEWYSKNRETVKEILNV